MIGKAESIGAWSGIVFVVLFFLGYWPLAGFLPPPAPSLSPLEVATLYRDHTLPIRLGVFVMMFAVVLFIPFSVALAEQMRRIAGIGPAMAQVQVIGSCITMTLIALSALLWGVIAFRPERNVDLTALLHDTAWLIFISPGPPACLLVAAFGFAVLADSRSRPIFPRWSGYASLWAAVLFVPAQMAIFFKHGPFAWDGLFPFWVAFTVFTAWVLVAAALLKRAARIQ